jgi:hypothetical protein
MGIVGSKLLPVPLGGTDIADLGALGSSTQ